MNKTSNLFQKVRGYNSPTYSCQTTSLRRYATGFVTVHTKSGVI